MKKRWMLLKLYTKSAFLSVPKILLGTLVLSLVVILFSFCLEKAVNTDKNEKMKIAIVITEGDEDIYVRMAINFAKNVDTVNNICEFAEESRENAIEGVKSGKYMAAMIIPPKLIHDIMVGINTPIEVVYADSGVTNTSAIFREMFAAGASDLATAESGVYALDDLFYDGALRSYRKTREKYEDELNLLYFDYALDRAIYYKVTDISNSRGLNTIQYYVAAAILLLLLLSGITCADHLKNDSKALALTLKTQGIGNGNAGFAKVCSLTLVYYTLFLTVLLIGLLAKTKYAGIGYVLKINTFFSFLGVAIGLLFLIFSVFCFIYFIFRIVENPVYSVLVLFLVGIVCMFASGCFIPASMLPRLVRQIGIWLPTNAYFALTGQIISGSVEFITIVINVVYSTVLLLAATFVANKRTW